MKVQKTRAGGVHISKQNKCTVKKIKNGKTIVPVAKVKRTIAEFFNLKYKLIRNIDRG